jgi:hypothetical protein
MDPHQHARLTVAAGIAVVLYMLLAPTGLANGDGDGGGASAAGASQPSANPEDPKQIEPIRVRFRLTDGVTVSGELTAWGPEGIDGSFGRRRWVDLEHDDIWSVYHRVMDRESSTDWLGLGRALMLASLDQPRAERRAELAFNHALRLDAGVEERIDEIRDEIEAIRQERRDAERAARDARLNRITPEARDYGDAAWPLLSDDAQRAAAEAMREAASRILDDAGLDLELVETKHFLLYSTMPRSEAAKWALTIEGVYDRLARFFVPMSSNIFHGKAVVMIFETSDRFRLVEVEAFDQLVDEDAISICHPDGPNVFLNFWRHPDDERLREAMERHVGYAFLHRYSTPKRLPAWANDGIAVKLTADPKDGDSLDDLDRREAALEFIRADGSVEALLHAEYGEHWPGPRMLGRGVGALLVELMVREKPKAFRTWVLAVKAGKDWKQALEENYGTSYPTLRNLFVQYYRVND